MKKSQIVILVSIVLIVLELGHAVLYQALAFVFPMTGLALDILIVVMFVLPFAFVASIFISSNYNNYFTRIFYLVTATWIGFLLMFFTASVLIGIIGIFTLNLLWGKILLGLALLVGLYGMLHERHINLVQHEIALPNLSDFWVGKKIVFVSDLHLGQIHGRRFAAKVARKIQALNPDLILVGGDLFDGVEVDNQKVAEPLRQLKPEQGIYFVTGNHDGFTERSTEEDIADVSQIGIRVLQNEVLEIHGLQIIGVGYRESASSQQFQEILAKINFDQDKPSILLKHVPDNLDLAAAKGFSLQLSGHTHRAQLWPFRFIAKLVYKNFEYGLKNFNEKMQVLVSSGVGTWGPPLRVGTNSEIILISFKKK